MTLNAGFVLSLLLSASLMAAAGPKIGDAAGAGDLAQVRASLAAGSKINDADKFGWTPLMWATYWQQETAVRWLLSHGADPNLRSTSKNYSYPFPAGSTALSIAAYYGMDEIVKLLLLAKVDPNRPDDTDRSPLDYARDNKKKDSYLLMKNGVTPSGPMHSFFNPVLKGKVDDLIVQIDTGIPNSGVFLQDLKNELSDHLKKRQIHYLLFAIPNLTPELEKEVRSQSEAFNPKYVLQWHEVTGKVAYVSDRHTTHYRVRLCQSGSDKVLWEREIDAQDTKYPVSYCGDAFKVAARKLVDEMEADLLL